MALEIFKLVGSVFVDTGKAEESLNKTDKKAGGLGKTLLNGIGTAAKWGAGIAAAAGAGAAALYGVATKAASAADTIDKMSQRLGLSREAYQELDFVLSQSGVDIDSFQTGMKSLLKNMDAVTEGNKTATENFKRLGVEVKNTDGSMRSQEEVLFDTVSAFQAMEDSAEKSRLAQELFGKQGQEILPLLNAESGSLEEMRQQAHDLGLVLGDETVDAGVKFTDTVDQAKRSLSAIMTQIGAGVMPIFQSALEWVLSNMPLIQSVCSTVFNAISVLVTWVGEVFQTVCQAISGAISGSGITMETVMTTIQKVFQAAMAFIRTIWNTIGQPVWNFIQQAVTLVAGYFQKKMPAIQSFVKTAFTDIQKLWENNLQPALKAIGDFINNVLAPAFKFVFNTIITPVVDTAFRTIKQLWTGTLKPVFQGILDFITGVFTLNFKKAFSGLVTAISGIWNGLKTVVKAPLNAVIDIINGFIRNINKLKIPDWVPGVGGKGINIGTIPHLEQGAVLERGQVGLLEGNGAEAVVPLHQNKKWISAVAQDMEENGLSGGAASQELLDAFLEFVAELPRILSRSLDDTQLKVNNREFARLVKAVK